MKGINKNVRNYTIGFQSSGLSIIFLNICNSQSET